MVLFLLWTGSSKFLLLPVLITSVENLSSVVEGPWVWLTLEVHHVKKGRTKFFFRLGNQNKSRNYTE